MRFSSLRLSFFQIVTTPSWSRWTPRWAPPSPWPPPPPTRTGPRPARRAPTTTTTTTASRPTTTTNLHRVTSQWCDPQRIINKGRARGQFFPDLKIPAVSSLSCSGSAEFITKGLTYVIFRHLQRILLLYWHLNYWLGHRGSLIPPARVYPRIYFFVQLRTNVKVKAAACTIQINGNNLDSS